LESGVIALFGEKYGDVVRVVRIGEPGAFVSQELCGGTHVRETAEIGQFRILTEGSVGAGIRRIEAVTGRAAQQHLANRLAVLESAAALLDCPPEDVPMKLRALIDQSQRTKREADGLRTSLAQRDFEQLMRQATLVDGAAVLAASVDVHAVETLRQMTDWFRDQHSSGVVVLGTVIDGRPLLISAVTPDLTKRGLFADELMKKLAPIIGGGGGGRPTLAQAGGRDAERLDEALSSVLELVKTALT
jgi:alanyl-tRNA synthetase